MVPLELVEILEKAAMQLGTAFERVKAEEASKRGKHTGCWSTKFRPWSLKGIRIGASISSIGKLKISPVIAKEEFDSRQLKWCDLILPEDLDMASG